MTIATDLELCETCALMDAIEMNASGFLNDEHPGAAEKGRSHPLYAESLAHYQAAIETIRNKGQEINDAIRDHNGLSTKIRASGVLWALVLAMSAEADAHADLEGTRVSWMLHLAGAADIREHSIAADVFGQWEPMIIELIEDHARRAGVRQPGPIDCQMTAGGWGLYTDRPEAERAAAAINAEANRLVNVEHVNASTFHAKMWAFMDRYADLGAHDSEPLQTLRTVTEAIYPEAIWPD